MGKRKNINFRQTEKEFKSQNISKIFQHFKTNIPYKIYNYSIKGVSYPINKLRKVYKNFNKKLPKTAKKDQ